MSNIKLFENKKIRSVWEEKEQKWYFVVEDVIAILTDSNDPKQYVKKMRQRDAELSKGWVQIVPTLWVDTAGGKQSNKRITSAILFFLFFSLKSFAQIQSSDTIAIPNDTLKNFNKNLFGDSLASSFFIVIHKEVKLHKHQFHSEHVYVISGEGDMTLGNEKRKIKSGDIIFIPKETPHALKVTSKTPVKILSVQSPFFDGTDRIMLE